MPIYEYACENCGHTLDALQKMSDDPLLECPECAKLQLKRLLSAPRFRLKGAGWYETDFKKENQRNLSSGDAEPKKSDKDEGKSAEPKTDTGSKTADSGKKPEKKSNSKSDDK